MNTLSILFALCSGLVHTTAFFDYNRKTLSGRTKPNGATWAIWATIAVISSATYLSACGDVWKSLLSFSNIALSIGTFLLALCHGKFQKLDPSDWIALLLGAIAIGVWKASTAACANMVVQIAIAIGFIPTWRAIRRNPSCEHPRPWWLWATAYCIAFSVVLLRWRHQWTDLVFPCNGILLHASVPLLVAVEKKRLHIPQESAQMPVELRNCNGE